MSWCGQPWTSDELVNASALDVVYASEPLAADENRYPGLTRVDDDGRAHVPALPNRWPRCPMCDAPLHRIKMGEQWHCAPPQMSHLELVSA